MESTRMRNIQENLETDSYGRARNLRSEKLKKRNNDN